MKTRRTITLVTTLCMAWVSQGQDWNANPGGNVITTNEWFGARLGSTIPLRIETRVNQPIQLYTNSVQRMRLNQNVTSAMGPGDPFPGVQRNGYLLLSGQPNAFTNPASRAPFTRLHLIDQQTGILDPVVYAQEHGFRPWQRNGITFTGNSDQSYIGHKYAGNDNTDFVIQWSDNPNGSPWGVDRMKFVFTTDYNMGANRGAATLDGLEAMRFFPEDNLEVFMGVGDYGAVLGDPSERVDLLNGRLRIRQLPDDPPAIDSFYVMVVDRSDTTLTNRERGVVKWVDPNDLPGAGADCDWEVTAAADVVTAFDPAPPDNCPGEANNVGVGVEEPIAKLDVLKVVNSGAPFDEGIRSVMRTTAPTNVGGRAFVLEPDQDLRNIGWQGHAEGAGRNWGVDGNAAWNSLVNQEFWGGARVVGVRGFADGNFAIDPNNIRGVWGIGINPQSGGMAYGGWFDGYVYSSSGYVTGPSDQQLKENIVPLTGAMNVIAQLDPKAYHFRVAEFPSLALVGGQRYGFIAQEVEEVLPALVSDLEQPAQVDEMGNELNAAVAFKGMNMTDLIPWMVAGMQEQQAVIQEQQAQLAEQATRLDQLEAQLGDCCSQMIQGGDLRGMEPAGPTPGERLLTIVPNPVSEFTAIGYTLERGGRVMLLLTGSDGRKMQVLHEAHMEAGQFQHDWHTAQLAAGVYHITLLLDGEPLVKRAVKL